MGAAGLALMLLIGGATAAGAATRGRPIHIVARSPACRAGLHQLRAERGTFDSRYDHILTKGIIGTACAHGASASRSAGTCRVAAHMYGLFEPLYKTQADRALAQGVVTAACG